MTKEQLAVSVANGLARVQKKLIEAHATPLFTVGVMHEPSPNKGRYFVVKPEDGMALSDLHAMLVSMADHVAQQLGAS